MIAIALSCDPVLLIADEPTTALDVTIQAQILALLAELKRSRGMSMVLITHDMGAVAGVADRVAVMRDGEVIEVDTVDAVFKAPKHEYTRALLAAIPSLGRGPIHVRVGSPSGHVAAGHIVAGRGAVAAGASPAALVLDDVHVQFKVRNTPFGPLKLLRAVDGVSLELAPGEAIGVVGESGSGKSTLARAALQLIRTQSGRVVWLGRSVDALTQAAIRPLRRDVQVIFQDPLASLDPRMTAGEIVAEPLQVHRPDLDRTARDATVSRALARVRLDAGLATRYPHELSGGQCQRVGIARAMVLEPQLLICDEPISALDVTVQEQIVSLLADLKRESGLAILFISHNLAVVRQLCERILVLYLGRMMELAPATAIYTHPLHPYTRELLDSAPIPDPDVQPGATRTRVTGRTTVTAVAAQRLRFTGHAARTPWPSVPSAFQPGRAADDAFAMGGVPPMARVGRLRGIARTGIAGAAAGIRKAMSPGSAPWALVRYPCHIPPFVRRHHRHEIRSHSPPQRTPSPRPI